MKHLRLFSIVWVIVCSALQSGCAKKEDDSLAEPSTAVESSAQTSTEGTKGSLKEGSTAQLSADGTPIIDKRKELSNDQYHEEYIKLQANEQDAQIRLQQSGRLKCNIELLSEGNLAEWAKKNGLPPLKVIVGISAFLFQTKDEDFIPLSQLTEVKYISCSGSKITDKALSHIAGLKKLEVLYIGDTQVADRGLINLEELSELRELWLRGTRVTDKGIRHLKGLSKLESLLISRTSLSDVSLMVIKNLTSLRSLDISSTNVTDAGVLELKELKNL